MAKELLESRLPVRIHNSINHNLGRALFYDLLLKDEIESGDLLVHTEFVLKSREDYVEPVTGKVYLSLYKLFMSMTEKDPTEYDFAMGVFNSLSYWESFLSQRTWFIPHLTLWRKEKDARVRAGAVSSMLKQVRTGTAGFSTLKYLADNGYIESASDHKVGAGRPSKERIKEEAEKLFQNSNIVDLDWSRISTKP